MRFAWKLVVVLWVGICLVYGINGWLRYEREAELFATDMQVDHAAMGRGLAAAVAEVWQHEGKDRALDVLERANEHDSTLRIRWVGLDGVDTGPLSDAADLARARQGEFVSVTDASGRRRHSYVPLHVGESWMGALELSESLEAGISYQRTSLRRMILVFTTLTVVTGGLALALGVQFVGRPIRLLAEKARRVGAGDFTAELVLSQRDELGELAGEMNAMSRRLADARTRLAAEAANRIAAMEELRHAERLTTVGKLASGVAHELGTPLNVIHVRARLISGGEVDLDAAREGARIIAEQTERITKIVRQLLDFARRRTREQTSQNLVALVERSVALLRPLATKAGVAFDVGWTAPSMLASVDGVQIQQVIANLVMNGVQAMSGGGTLSVHLRRARVTPPADVAGLEDAFVAIEVRDTGPGISAADVARVFDPFFTTKEVGEGTGLGLSVAYGIVREHGGWISVSSAPGQGATFTVFVPEVA